MLMALNFRRWYSGALVFNTPRGYIDRMRKDHKKDGKTATLKRLGRIEGQVRGLARDHAGEAAHLAFDAAEPFERCRLAVLLVVLAHAVYIPPGGIEDKSPRIPPPKVECHEHARRAPSSRRSGRRRRDRSGLRHDGRSAHRQAAHRLPGPHLLFLLRLLPHKIHRRSAEISWRARTRAGGRRRDLHLPDASRNPPGRPRRLPA